MRDENHHDDYCNHGDDDRYHEGESEQQRKASDEETPREDREDWGQNESGDAFQAFHEIPSRPSLQRSSTTIASAFERTSVSTKPALTCMA